jgi:hypothetical protein
MRLHSISNKAIALFVCECFVSVHIVTVAADIQEAAGRALREFRGASPKTITPLFQITSLMFPRVCEIQVNFMYSHLLHHNLFMI